MAWEPDPVVLSSSVLALAAFGQGFLRLRRRGRGDLAPWTRAALFATAVGVAVLALVSPLHHAAEHLLSAHMLQHVVIGDVAPALALVALRGPLLFFLAPAPLLRRVAALRGLGALVLHPAFAILFWASSLAAWHVPAVYDAAVRHPQLHALEHGSFALGGLLVWMQLIDPARRGRLRPRVRLGYAFALFVGGQMLASTLILSYRPLYPLYAEQQDRLLGLSALADQNDAGLVMMAGQLLTLGTFAALQLRAWIRAPLALAPGRHPFAA